MMLGRYRRWRIGIEARREGAILDAIAHGEIDGAGIAKKTGLGTGVLYPTLFRLEERGAVTSRWDGSSRDGDPRRRLYRAVEPDCGPWGYRKVKAEKQVR